MGLKLLYVLASNVTIGKMIKFNIIYVQIYSDGDKFMFNINKGLFACALSGLILLSGTAFAQDEPLATFTEAQVERGLIEYRASCMDCHGPNLDDGEFGGPPLKGMSFRGKFFDQPVDTLFYFTQSTMPQDRPGRLSEQTYADLIAYILSHNGMVPGDVELPADPEALGELYAVQPQ